MARSGSGDWPIEPEHLDATADPGTDEVLTAGRRSRMSHSDGRARRFAARVTRPRWLPDLASLTDRWQRLAPGSRRGTRIAVIALALAVAAGVIALARPARTVPVAKPAPVASSSSARPPVVASPASTFDPNADAPSATGPALAVPGGAVRDVAIASNDLYVVSASAVSVVDSYSRQVLRTTPITTPTSARAVLDIGAGTIWVVDIGAVQAQAREFDMAGLTMLRTVDVPGLIYDVAMLTGRLYLATSGGVYDIEPGSTKLTAVAATIPPAQALSVDVQDDVLYALSPGPTGRLIQVTDGGNSTRAGPAVNVSFPTVAFMNDGLWVGGVGTNGALLLFDKKTLGRLPDSAGGAMISDSVGSGLQLTAGVVNLWVYGRFSKQELSCVDASSGNVLQHWDGITQSVATGGSGPYVVSLGTVTPLVLRGRCLG